MCIIALYTEAGNGREDAGVGEMRRLEPVPLHLDEHHECHLSVALPDEPGNQRIPRHVVPRAESAKHRDGLIHPPMPRVHVKQRAPDVHVIVPVAPHRERVDLLPGAAALRRLAKVKPLGVTRAESMPGRSPMASFGMSFHAYPAMREVQEGDDGSNRSRSVRRLAERSSTRRASALAQRSGASVPECELSLASRATRVGSTARSARAPPSRLEERLAARRAGVKVGSGARSLDSVLQLMSSSWRHVRPASAVARSAPARPRPGRRIAVTRSSSPLLPTPSQAQHAGPAAVRLADRAVSARRMSGGRVIMGLGVRAQAHDIGVGAGARLGGNATFLLLLLLVVLLLQVSDGEFVQFRMSIGVCAREGYEAQSAS
jgi:hypothetical protein